jgi:hypothetical protein
MEPGMNAQLYTLRDVTRLPTGGRAKFLRTTVVATGMAAECAATLAIFPGDQVFRIGALRDGNGMTLDSGRWARLMDLSLASAGESYALTPMLLARYGHFTSPDRPWEQIRFGM